MSPCWIASVKSMTTTPPGHEAGNVSGIIIYVSWGHESVLLGPCIRLLPMHSPTGMPILAGLCCEVPRVSGSAQVSGPAKFTARGTTSQNTWAPGLDNLGPNQGPDPLGPHGGESRIEPGSTPGTHFSLLHSPGLLSVGAFLLLLLLPVPHNLAPSVTLSRISSSLPRHDPDERSPSIPTAPNSSSRLRGAIQTLLAIKSFPRGWFTGIQQDTVQDREGRRRETETTQPRSDCRLSLALHLYRLLYAAFNSPQRSHIFPGQDVVGRPANAVSYQITRQRNALHVIATRCNHHRHDSTPLHSSKHRELTIERRPDSGLTGV